MRSLGSNFFDVAVTVLLLVKITRLIIKMQLSDITVGFPGGSDGKGSACNAGDLGSVPGLGRFPGGGRGNPLQYSCLENPYGPRILGYSPWGCKELDKTE